MKTFCRLLLLLQIFPHHAQGAAPISFVAQVESDALAEEAILLLHCLANRTDTSWEFSGEIQGSHWLRVLEKKGALEGTYRRGETTKSFALKQGEADQACERLEPGSPLIPARAENSFPSSLRVTEGEEPRIAPKTWIWVGIASAALGGFFFWRSRQPDHRGVEMR
jgi:hypothetical protein